MKKQFFDQYLLKNHDGSPIKMYRGFHADEDEVEQHLDNPFITYERPLPTFTGSPHAASLYSVSPNNRNHNTGDSCGVVGIYEIAMINPLRLDDSRFIDYEDLLPILKAKIHTREWQNFMKESLDYGVWNHDGDAIDEEIFQEMSDDEKNEMYIETYHFCDNPIVVGIFRQLGYDGFITRGVIHLDNDLRDKAAGDEYHYDKRDCSCSEYRPFNKYQVRFESNKELVYQPNKRELNKELEVEVGL
ncbi:hypothetical protein D3C87_587620 [compost metagenome]